MIIWKDYTGAILGFKFESKADEKKCPPATQDIGIILRIARKR